MNNTPKKITTMCRLCSKPIMFNSEFIGLKLGKLIPLDTLTEESHQCEVREQQPRRYVQCFKCKKDIYFDKDFVSKSGKSVSLSKSTGEPHGCDVMQSYRTNQILLTLLFVLIYYGLC